MNETYISGALHEIADLDQTSAPPVQHLLHKGHRARSARNGGMAAVAVLAVAAIGVPLATATHHGGGAASVARGTAAPTTSTVDRQPSLVLAALTSVKTSFKASWTVTMPDGPATRYTGVFDPGHKLSDMMVDVPSNRVATVSESYSTRSTPATITYTFSDYGIP